ncbi:MAG: hypothetical protein ACRBFS_19625 [Aureispira sp.]
MSYKEKQQGGTEWIYGIVRVAHRGLREEWNSEALSFTPLSMTSSTSRQLVFDNGRICIPWRDFSHMIEDSKGLGFPAFITCPALELIEDVKERQMWNNKIDL